ncbi:MAG: putative acetyltransferase [Bacilli bacterium]|nr:putative acetyltransferase [Bacilli bacterium]
MITIRPIEKKDMSFLWEMLYEMIYIPEDKPSQEELVNRPENKKYFDGWGRNGDKGLIAFNIEGKPIGTVWYRLFDEINKGYGYVDSETPELSIGIRPEYTGQGIGTKLLKTIIKHAKQEGFKTISLSVDPNNDAFRLYQRIGFEKCGVSGTSWTMKLMI